MHGATFLKDLRHVICWWETDQKYNLNNYRPLLHDKIMAYKVTQKIKYKFFNLFIIKSIHLIKIYIAISIYMYTFVHCTFCFHMYIVHQQDQVWLHDVQRHFKQYYFVHVASNKFKVQMEQNVYKINICFTIFLHFTTKSSYHEKYSTWKYE